MGYKALLGSVLHRTVSCIRMSTFSAQPIRGSHTLTASVMSMAGDSLGAGPRRSGWLDLIMYVLES